MKKYIIPGLVGLPLWVGLIALMVMFGILNTVTHIIIAGVSIATVRLLYDHFKEKETKQKRKA